MIGNSNGPQMVGHLVISKPTPIHSGSPGQLSANIWLIFCPALWLMAELSNENLLQIQTPWFPSAMMPDQSAAPSVRNSTVRAMYTTTTTGNGSVILNQIRRITAWRSTLSLHPKQTTLRFVKKTNQAILLRVGPLVWAKPLAFDQKFL